MKRFVKFLLHEYMDEEPSIQVMTFSGDTLEKIEEAAREHADFMNQNYSGGTTTFIKVFNAQEAEEWLDQESTAPRFGEHGWELPTPEQVKETHDALYQTWEDCYRPITRDMAIDRAKEHGLEGEVIFYMDHRNCSPKEALQEWDLL